MSRQATETRRDMENLDTFVLVDIFRRTFIMLDVIHIIMCVRAVSAHLFISNANFLLIDGSDLCWH